MKLRNRETGEIGEIRYENHELYVDTDGGFTYWLRTIAELNERWEDYKPTDPLIKDERIRKAVRAWAKALGLQEVYCASNGYEIYGGTDDWVIQFEGEPFPFADKNKIYTIAELCGEEEE